MNAISPVEALGAQCAQHRHHRRDAAAAGDEQDAPRPLRRAGRSRRRRSRGRRPCRAGRARRGRWRPGRRRGGRRSARCAGRPRRWPASSGRVRRRPSISTVRLMCWPARKPVNARLGSRVSVTLRGVCRRTATTLARASPVVQVGATSSVYRSTPWGPVSRSTSGDRSTRARQSLSEHMYTVRHAAGRRQWIRAGCGRFHTVNSRTPSSRTSRSSRSSKSRSRDTPVARGAQGSHPAGHRRGGAEAARGPQLRRAEPA